MSITSNDQGLIARVMRLFNPAKNVSLQTARTGESIGEIARLDPDAALARLGSRAEGLSADEAAGRLERYGKNVVAREEHASVSKRLLILLLNPLNVMLLVLAVINFFFLGDLESGGVVTVMIVLSVTLSFV